MSQSTLLPSLQSPKPARIEGPISRAGGIWLGILLALLALGSFVGLLLLGEKAQTASDVAFSATVALGVLWLGWGLWRWREVVWVRRLAWFYFATLAITALAFAVQPIRPKFTDFLLGAWGMTLLFYGGLWLFRAILTPPWPFLGIARTLIDEAVRMKIALVFIIFTVVLVPYLPLFIDPKERLQYRLQFFLSWSIAGVSLLLSLMTIFLACGTICNEIKQRQIFLTMTKPVSRFQYLLGKWVGIVLVDLLLISVAGVGIYAGVSILAFDKNGHINGLNPIDDYRVTTEVMVARQSVQASPPGGKDADDLYTAHLKQYRLDNHSDAVGPASDSEDTAVKAWIKANWLTIGPGEAPIYTFHGLEDAKHYDDYLQLRIKANTSPDPANHKLLLGITFNGKPSRTSSDGRPMVEQVTSNQYEIIEIPPQVIDDKGDLNVGIFNFLPSSVNLEPGNGLEILYRVGGFAPNLVRTLLILWIKLCFLAILGLTAGTFLGFAVASLASLVIFIMATFSDFIANALNEFAISKASEAGAKPSANPTISALLAEVAHGHLISALMLVLNALDQVLLSLLSAFSSYSPIDLLVDGRWVSPQMVVSAAGWILLGWTFVCGLIGVAAFYRRELARVTV